MKLNIQYLIAVFAILLAGCSKDIAQLQHENVISQEQDVVIEIDTERYGETADSTALASHRTGLTRSSDPLTEIRDVKSFESVILPELQPHIWVGNTVKKSSIADCDYSPLVYSKNPIDMSLTLRGSTPAEITSPSYSNYLRYIQAETAKGNYAQNGEFSFSIEQFESYHELKTAFGSNVDTQKLFWGSSSSDETETHMVSKATGMYVKFYQTSFKAIMDYPQGSIAEIPSTLINDAVYVNSVTYGRLGILTLETNSSVVTTKQQMNTIFRKLFSSGSTTLTSSEQSFLNGCSFKAYLIGGNGSTGVQSFSGYAGFIQHIKKGSFSADEPGEPIFCTFNHVKDNSAVSINFKYNIKKKPIYVEVVHVPKTGTPPIDIHNRQGAYEKYGDLELRFYKNASRMPIQADPAIKFTVRLICEETTTFPTSHTCAYFSMSKEFQNTGNQLFLKIKTDVFAADSWCHQIQFLGNGYRSTRYADVAQKYSYDLTASDHYLILPQNHFGYSFPESIKFRFERIPYYKTPRDSSDGSTWDSYVPDGYTSGRSSSSGSGSGSGSAGNGSTGGRTGYSSGRSGSSGGR